MNHRNVNILLILLKLTSRAPPAPITPFTPLHTHTHSLSGPHTAYVPYFKGTLFRLTCL